METFELIERKIGRSLESCIDVPSGPDTLRCHIDALGREVNVWVPSFEVYREIALDVINHYRAPQTFTAEVCDLWPYIDTYQSLNLTNIVGMPQDGAVSELDRIYLSGLVETQTETVYHRAREALVFSDGVQVMDPFIPLMTGKAFNAAWKQVEDPAFHLMPFPPATVLAQFIKEQDSWTDLTYSELWVACLQEAVELLPLVRTGYIRFTPGSRLMTWNIRRFIGRSDLHGPLIKAIEAQMQSLGPAPAAADRHSVMRSGQTIVDAAVYDHSAPFFFSSEQLRHGQGLLEGGFADALGVNRVKTRRANLPTLASVDIGKVSPEDLLAIRRDDDTFNKWRSFRREMAGICLRNSSDAEIRDACDDLTSDWRRTLRREQQKQSFVAQNLRREGLLYGAVGAIVAGGGAALTSPVTIPALLIMSASGALTGGVMQVANQWRRERRPAQLRAAAELAFERHLLAVDRRPRSGLEN